MKKSIIPVLLIVLAIFISACDNNDPSPNNEIIIPDGYSMFWSDEFNDESINTANWQFELGDGTDYGLPAGWGNNELQLYTSDAQNAAITSDDGLSVLQITALKGEANSYSSAKLVTKDLASFRYGIIEIKAKMPEGQGLWPAIWMLGDNQELIDWPGCGEIDIAEVLGHEPNKYYSTVHYTNGEKKKGETQAEHTLSTGRFSSDYHVFSLDWNPEAIKFYVDGMLIQTIPIEDDMKEFQRSMYMILNVAVGGYWPGEPNSSTIFPQSMYVDYVRVFTKDGFSPEAPPELNIDEETIGQIIEPNIGDNAIKEGFTDFGSLEVISYGGGGEPVIGTSETAIDGEMSLEYEFPGGNWGGAYIELAEPQNLASYTLVKFFLHLPASLADAEIKLESVSNNKSVYLKDYTGVDAGNGFVEYTIPLTDFGDVNFVETKIPFSIWNPTNSNGGFVAGAVLIDKLHFAN